MAKSVAGGKQGGRGTGNGERGWPRRCTWELSDESKVTKAPRPQRAWSGNRHDVS